MNGYSKAVLAVSDLHAGSIHGMMPPGFVTSDGAPKPQNAGQKFLWQCWLDLEQRVSELPIVGVYVNGDAIEGEEHRARGAELSLPLLADQSECAAICLRHLLASIKSKPPVFVIRGTPYHDSPGGREAEVVAEKIGAKRYRGYGAGRLAKRAADWECDGVVINVSHGISASGGLYRATAPDREAVWSALAGKVGKVARADVLVRSHAHYFTHLEHPSKHAVIVPCWQLQTDYMGKNSFYRMLPDIGAVLLWIDGDAKKKGEDPVVVQKFLYPLPPLKPVKL
jgi:hypothetical protein